jgi:hypothetical protein
VEPVDFRTSVKKNAPESLMVFFEKEQEILVVVITGVVGHFNFEGRNLPFKLNVDSTFLGYFSLFIKSLRI